MKQDCELKQKVLAELEWDPAIDAGPIGVAVEDGVVTVSGLVNTFAEKAAVAAAIDRVAGVRAVALEMEVRLAIPHRRSDGEIAASAEQALRSNTLVPSDAVRLAVEKGCVTLQGEVPWEFQRRAAERAVATLIGVVEVRNEVTLQTSGQVANVAQRIEEALGRQASREAARIHVAVEGTTVKLTGLVNSWHDRDMAEAAARAAPGIDSDQRVAECMSCAEPFTSIPDPSQRTAAIEREAAPVSRG